MISNVSECECEAKCRQEGMLSAELSACTWRPAAARDGTILQFSSPDQISREETIQTSNFPFSRVFTRDISV